MRNKTRGVLPGTPPRCLWLLLLLLAAVLRFWQLDNLPAEMWGDVIEGYKFVQRVLTGDFYWRYEFGGDGPLFSYLVALLTSFFGLSFWTMKAATALVGILLVLVVYFLGKEYGGWEVGFLAAFLMAVSKWSLIFSRLGKPHILASLFAAVSFLFLLKFLRSKQGIWVLGCGVSLGLGMYTQAAFWGAPLAVLAVLLVYFFQRREIPGIKLLLSGLVFLILLLPFLNNFVFRFAYFLAPSSFFGEKMGDGWGRIISGALINLGKNLAMFHFVGGRVFRNNPAGTPQLDFLSGVFFILGIFVFRRKLEFWLPFFLLQVPSLLDVNNPASTPNAGRTIGLLSWVYILVSAGIFYFYKKIRKFFEFLWQYKSKDKLSREAIACGVRLPFYGILFLIMLLNFQQVFRDYKNGLPNRNTPFGRIIAREIDKASEDVAVYVLGCCWGEWEQPEPGSIKYRLKRRVYFFQADGNEEEFSCFSLKKELQKVGKRRFLLVVDPREKEGVFLEVEDCVENKVIYPLRKSTFEIGWIVKGEVK